MNIVTDVEEFNKTDKSLTVVIRSQRKYMFVEMNQTDFADATNAIKIDKCRDRDNWIADSVRFEREKKGWRLVVEPVCEGEKEVPR
jgi:hypothetical protein